MARIASILRWCERQLGDRSWAGKCQAFVSYAVEAGTGQLVTYPSAIAGRSACMKKNTANDRSPPAGAACYYRGTGELGRRYGHVGISDGKGNIYEAWSVGVVKHTFAQADEWNNGYLGWGWHGNIPLDGASSAGSAADSWAAERQKQKDDGRSDDEESLSLQPESVQPESVQVEISTVVEKNITGSFVKRRAFDIADAEADSDLFLLVQGERSIWRPMLTDAVKVTSERSGSPGKMTFSYVDVDGIDIGMGNAVAFRYRGEKIFFGYIFDKKYDSDRNKVDVTCYDQLRYFKNKDSFVFSGSYSDLLRYLCGKHGFSVGSIENTGFLIPTAVFEGTLFDLCGEASASTTLNRGVSYVLYDDFGRICLRSLNNMTLPLLLDRDTSGSWTLKESIDGDVYNRVVLSYDDKQTGERTLYIANDAENQKRWGALTLYESANCSAEIAQSRANEILNYYDRPKKTFSVNNCLGYPGVRGGSLLLANYDIGNGETIRQLLLVNKAEHTFAEGEHLMSLNLYGGDFSSA